MIIEPIDHGLILSAPTEGYVRTPGLHMSDIYNDLYRDLNPKRYDKRDAAGNPFPFNELYTGFGTAFEEALEPVIRKRYISAERPGEYATQHSSDCIYRIITVLPGDPVCPCGAGVIYTPDHFLFNGVFRLGEFKATWMTCKHGIRDKRFDKWFCQIKAYCYHLRTVYARLYVFFVVGDYTDMAPQFPPGWDIEFTQKELDSEWAMLLRHARKKGLLPVV